MMKEEKSDSSMTCTDYLKAIFNLNIATQKAVYAFEHRSVN